MGIFEEIKKRQEEGKSDQDIILLLQASGYGIKEASDAVAQTRIKEAISSSQDPAIISQYGNQDQEMMQSIANQPQQIPKPKAQQEQQMPQYQQEQQEQQMPQYQQEQQEQPQQYQDPYQAYGSSGSSADVVSEIAEQIVSEKMSVLRKQIEIIIDLKNSNEVKIISIDERLKRLEKIIDRIQLSILQKVGEYITNVEDIKKEIVESQKSFKTLLSSKGHKTDYKNN
ncbi:MAG: hypothetical protein AABX85_01980 [Nanoarchaeota archaeon]